MTRVTGTEPQKEQSVVEQEKSAWGGKDSCGGATQRQRATLAGPLFFFLMLGKLGSVLCFGSGRASSVRLGRLRLAGGSHGP